ncbi:alpha/beta hydrolase [Caloranaerobacter sp. TR13]|uniref:alpha/beta fold hydrolase n=1 Tax=Caloranaerobacter sp. TR13 TaxID=1302151 RepID=UPI0006D44D01|nr:alpha/beta hydrolase [Caloranaerobacter sp. TR13]KPU28353.1 alpha/beta hydrolase [Caloranaerobacter sp. TR13]
MENLRKYGNEPFNVAVIHGGPGAPGGMAPVARELSQICGVLEPLQTANSIEGQILELKDILENNAESPVILIGHSWGVWLSYIFAAQYPQLIKKLILVGSGSFEEKYLSTMKTNRTSRLTEEENLRVEVLIRLLNDPNNENKKEVLSEFGKLMSKADSFAPICLENEVLDFQPDVFQNCMNEVTYLRKSKKLLEIGSKIKCPVIAIHGEYDSHTFEGVEKPLSKVLKDFQFILLKDCGHYPWNELYAKDKFYEILYQELSSK